MTPKRMLAGCESGNIAILTAIAAMAVFLSMGFALDYSRATDLKARLQSAADFAVLAALNPNNTAPDLEAEAERLFRATLDPADLAKLGNVKATLESGASGPQQLSLSFNADNDNALMVIAGIPTTPVSGQASSRLGSRQNLRYHFLLDTSDSMGLAADDASRAQLKAATASEPFLPYCEFACHIVHQGAPDQSRPTYLAIARNLNLNLRVDVAKNGIMRVMDLAEDHRETPNQFSYSLTTFSNRLETVVPLTTYRNSIVSALNSIDIGYRMPGNDANTFTELAFPQMASWLGTNTNGQDIVVLVTDGVRSENDREAPEVRPISLAECDELKKNGRKLAVIYTEYRELDLDWALPPEAWSQYRETVGQFHDELEPRLQACASSPDLYAKGDSPSEIIRAFEDIFKKSYRQLYLAS